MKLVAIETSTPQASLAAAERNGGRWQVAASVDLPTDQRTAKTLAPALAGLLDGLGWRGGGPGEAGKLDAVAATTGPGSFTGLRIGVTAAKTLAYATGARAVGVNTLAVIARQWLAYPQCDHAPRTRVVLDAHRNEFFAADFEYPPTGDKNPPSVELIGHDAWLSSLTENDAVGGPGVGLIKDELPSGVLVAPEAEWRPRAETVALLAGEALDADRSVDPWRLLPDYYRLSAAEEKARAAVGRRAKDFFTQANFFLQSSKCVSEYCNTKMESDSPHEFYRQMEGVIVGVHHTFAAELLIKGILILDYGISTRGHNLFTLFHHEKIETVRNELERRFNDSESNGFSSDDFSGLLKSHAEHFQRYRYACEETPPMLDMSFTSFLCEQLRNMLHVRLVKSGQLPPYD